MPLCYFYRTNYLTYRPPVLAYLMTSLLALCTSLAHGQERYVHIEYQGEARYGLLKDKQVQLIEGELFAEHQLSSITLPLNKAKLLPATTPSKIIAVGLNFSSHNGSIKGANPRLFSKLPSSLTTHEQPIWLFPDSNNLHFEGELVVVIGKEARNISVAQAPNVIFGVTIGNDVTDRTWQATDLQWLRGKGADSFAPVAPWLATGLNYKDLLIETRLNGKVVQSESTRNLLFNADEIVSYASRYFTLYPGDLIFTGTPGRTQAMEAGDKVEVNIEGIGLLSNTVTPRP